MQVGKTNHAQRACGKENQAQHHGYQSQPIAHDGSRVCMDGSSIGSSSGSPWPSLVDALTKATAAQGASKANTSVTSIIRQSMATARRMATATPPVPMSWAAIMRSGSLGP